MERRFLSLSMFVSLAFAALSAQQVVTSQYDNARTGANLHETVLTPKNVNARQFGRLRSYAVDGPVYAQPLYLSDVEIPGKGRHNVLYVATEHDTVYAFDADRPGSAPLWQVSFLDAKRGSTPLRAEDVHCPFIVPEIGITSTPVIDTHTGTLYVLARTVIRHSFSDNEFMQHLHALAITTGVEKFGGPKLISASVPGKASDAVKGMVAFNPLRENPRASLLLVGNNVILTWASSCDVDPYHGWVMSYDSQTLAQKAVLNVTPDGSEGGIWASDTGPAADEQGNVFVPTGNGTFTRDAGGRDFGDSLLKLDPATLAIRDFFTPSNQRKLSDEDNDLGSSGPTLLQQQPGSHRHLLVQPGKDGTLYVIDRDRLGQFHSSSNEDIQELKFKDGFYGAVATWNGHVYAVASDDYLRDFVIAEDKLKPVTKATSPHFANPGATPSVSADGNKNGIVWVIATRTWNGTDRPAVLYAFDAAHIGVPIYSSAENAARDRASDATRFVIPVVQNGRVYFGTRETVEVYGLLR